MDFSGITTALITPFAEGKLDKSSFLKLLGFQIQEGITQFALASTTGENPALEDQEIETLCQWLKSFKEENKLNLKLILATGSYSTKLAIEKTKKAEDLGANGLLVVTPYYNKPPQNGLLLHYEKIAQASSLPIILYNVPSRTACSLELDTIKQLAQIENIVGIKEATGDIEFLKQIKQAVPKNFLLLSGDDPTCADFFNEGGQGAISAGANILAKELIAIFNSDPSERSQLFNKYKIFLEELFKETNPIGLKQALFLAGIISSKELRLPLLARDNPALEQALKKINKTFN
ncbi:MAG: 4-hydroxy-tetrahydrodipicolinate synthase [Oligoflexia bacterium]|nr:4-hydroxy-tetrahydrodipicolinate synthase [Oligoflexia bacterium]